MDITIYNKEVIDISVCYTHDKFYQENYHYEYKVIYADGSRDTLIQEKLLYSRPSRKEIDAEVESLNTVDGLLEALYNSRKVK